MSPTIKPFSPFNKKADADSLYHAIAGAGTDEQTLIDILTHRTYQQRFEIAYAFNCKYGWEYPLETWLSDEAGGVFGAIITHLANPPRIYLADDLLWAMKGSGTNEQTLIDILVPMTTFEKKRVKTAFLMTAHYSLGDYIVNDAKEEGNRQSAGFIDRFLSHWLNHRYHIVPNLGPKPINPLCPWCPGSGPLGGSAPPNN